MRCFLSVQINKGKYQNGSYQNGNQYYWYVSALTELASTLLIPYLLVISSQSKRKCWAAQHGSRRPSPRYRKSLSVYKLKKAVYIYCYPQSPFQDREYAWELYICLDHSIEHSWNSGAGESFCKDPQKLPCSWQDPGHCGTLLVGHRDGGKQTFKASTPTCTVNFLLSFLQM